MIEEKEIEIDEKLYNLCSELCIISSSIADKIICILPGDEKTLYIASKITKINNYINNIDLPNILVEKKNSVKNKLNEIYDYEKQIINMLNENNININPINDNIISIIDYLEPLINNMIDFSVSMSSRGIKKGILSYKREYNNVVNKYNELEKSISKCNQDTINIKEDINNQLSDYKTQVSNELDCLSADIAQKKNEIDSMKEKSNTDLDNIKKSYEDKIVNLEKDILDHYNIIKDDLKEKQKEVSTLVGILSNEVNIGEYKMYADKASEEKRSWYIITVSIFACAFVFMVIMTFFNNTNNVIVIIRYVFSFIMFGVGSYTATIASNLKKDEEYYRKQQLELASINLFLADMPDEVKKEIKMSLSSKMYGQARETYKRNNYSSPIYLRTDSKKINDIKNDI